jgi:glutamate-1-semialdehyde 2,1-aminomutase
VASRAEGGYIWDADGNRYVDYRLGFGPVILGHADPRVNEAVKAAIDDGNVYALTTEREIRVAEKIVELCPAVETVRFANSGTEATMHAIRVARAYTGREKALKFEGAYHGMHDYALWSTSSSLTAMMGSRRSPIPVAASSGIPKAIYDLVITLPFNDFDALERTVKQSGHDIACIITEPMLGNLGSIEPVPGFMDHIRALCDAHGIMFILDEVKTGFRVAPGGAQEAYGYRPDLATYAKSLGNGFPIAAFGGKREVMDVIGQGVAHGGTYGANTVAAAAAEKTLEIISATDALKTTADRGKQLQKGLSDILESYSVPYSFSGHPSMFGVHFNEKTPHDYRDWSDGKQGVYDQVLEHLIEEGSMPDPDSREPWFLCEAHTEADIAYTLEGFEKAVKVVLG